MQKLALTMATGAAILCAGLTASEAQVLGPVAVVEPMFGPPLGRAYNAGVRLAYGNADALHAAGCLSWGWQNQAWYNHCRWGRRAAVSVRYLILDPRRFAYGG
jgi:hypothetical protein